MGSLVAEVLAKLAVAVLQWFAARKDLRDAERARMLLAASELAGRALAWKADAAARPDGGAGLRDAGGTIRLQGDPPGPPGPTPGADVPPR